MIMTVRHPTPHDIAAFHMREMDALECLRIGNSPRDALAASVEGSEAAFLLLFDDEPAIAWGYARYPSFPSIASVWMLTTEVVEEHMWAFIREMRKATTLLDTLFLSYHALVLREYVQARRLLKLLHFREVDTGNPEFILMERKGHPTWVN